MFILDFSGGNTCKNNFDTIFKMIKSLSEIDPERKFIIKWQLFKKAGDNIPLLPEMFSHAYNIAMDFGFKTTASVFDKESLNYLLQYNIPFVKIANRPDLYWLIGEVPRKTHVIVSNQKQKEIEYLIYQDADGIIMQNHAKWGTKLYKQINGSVLTCVSKYPCNIKEYEKIFSARNLIHGISDHTTNWDLFRKYKPRIYECHFKLPDSTGPDAGPFARTPEQLKEIYNEI